jgi:type IV pilus assembly protein PilY1
MKTLNGFLFLVIILIPFHHAIANDTDLYILTQMMQQVHPDALILLDLSGSMNFTPAEDTMYVSSSSNCNSHNYSSSFNGPYYSLSGTGHTYQCTGIPQTGGPIYGDSSCSDATGIYKTSGAGHNTNCSKVAIAKRAIFSFLDTDNGTGTGTPDGIIDANDQNYLKIRMGYMRFYNCSNPEAVSSTSYNNGCNTLIDPLNTAYSTIYCNSGTSCTASSSASHSVSGEQATGGTPLAAALNEALYYFNYTKNSDSDAACRQKFVILITDGADTYACNGDGTDTQSNQYKRRRETVAQAKALANAGYYVFVVGFGTNMPYYQQNALNWSAYYGKTFNTEQSQSITNMYSIPYGQIYPSGIQQCQTSQYSKAGDGHYYANTYDPGEMGISGYAFIAQNSSQLDDAIQRIRNFIIALIAQSTSYVAPVVPINQFQHTDSENRMYLGMFKPTTTTFWEGNIKKYGIASTNTQTLSVGDVVDAETPPQLVMTSQNTIKDTALSYWSSTADGGDVNKGGVGQALLAGNPDSRNIYTYLGTNTDLTSSSNAFRKTNAAITSTLLGVSSTSDKNNVIDFIHGWDAWNWKNGPSNKRDWILGAFIHSRPLVVHYSSQDVIYAGANDGMLHAFDDASGNELWAFIPPDLLPNLKNFNSQLSSLQISVDGSPKVYIGSNQTILVFGERRGGNHYIALDVTNPSFPRFLWSISPNQIIQGTTITSTTAFQELGQTWSTPMVGQIKNGTGTKAVAFVAGGYDDTNEDHSPATPDAKGRAVYVIDIMTGNLIWKYANSDNSAMKYCIPSDIAPIDVNGDGLIERLHVGDVGGQVWRFDIGDMSNNGTNSWTGKVIFKGSGKIFYPPDVTFENDRGNGTYNMLSFGTGDREKPNDTSFVNTLYVIKDYDNDTNPPTPLPLIENNLVDVTIDTLQDPNASSSDKTTMLNNLRTKSGWYIRLNQSPGESQNPGEKCDGPALIFGGAVYFTTFTPSPASGTCTIGTGQGNAYILQYQTGNATFYLSDISQSQPNPKLTVNDRSMSIGTGLPSGIIVTIIGDTVTAYGGVAGGVFSPQLPITRSIVPIDWRIVF